MKHPGYFSKMRQILPSVQNFIEALREDLANRRSLLVILPSSVNADDVWALLRAFISARGFAFDEVYVADLPPDKPLITGLKTAVTMQWKASADPLSIEHFYEHAEGLPDVVYFEGFDALQPGRRKEILKFLAQWADAGHICADRGGTPMALCIMTSCSEAVLDYPATDTHLSVHWWWGLPTALELKLLCRMLNNNRDGPACQWIEGILPALAGSDTTLADHLWDERDVTVEGLLQRLNNYALMQQWDINELRDAGIEAFEENLAFQNGKSALLRSKEAKKLWSAGALYWTPEYGVQLNTAVLALMGKEKEIRHRLWRGQVEYLLPMLDRVRLAICERLTSLYGPAWPYRWEKPKYEEDYEAVKKDPMACELGYLHYLLKACKKMKLDRNLLPLVSQAKCVRNELAHYRPVEYWQYERLMKEAELLFEGPF